MNTVDYAQLYTRKLELIQKYGRDKIEVRLCHAPIGTNIIFLATELLNNSRIGYRSVVTNGHYGFDKKTIRDFNEKNGTQHALEPWVLQRYGEHYEVKEPWTIWFRGINDNDADSKDPEREIDDLERKMGRLRQSLRDHQVIEYGLCVKYVLRFNSNFIKFLAGKDFVEENKSIAVHIRRGDACSENLSEVDPNRKHFPLETYAKQMEKCIELGYYSFYLLTESQFAIHSLTEWFQGRAEIVSQNVDRSKFTNLTIHQHGQKNFIEFMCLDNPEFLKFTIESALIDIFNAQKCQGLIGTLSSQFSKLNYLNIVGNREREVLLFDLSGMGYRKFVIYPSIWGKKVKLLVIKERDVGLFSLVLQVINTILCIDEQRLNYIFHVEFGKYQNYYTGRNTWNGCFENFFLVDKHLVEGNTEIITSYEDQKWQNHVWDSKGKVYKVNSGIHWTASYYPRLGRNAILHHIDHHRVPTDDERNRASRIIAKYLKPKRKLLDKANEFYREYLAGYRILGVQFRGSDARRDPRREIASYSKFKEQVQRYLNSSDQQTAIFVATDEEAFLEFMQNNFSLVFAVSTVRHQEGEANVSIKGPLDKGMPAFVEKDRDGAVEGVMLDYLLLCRCDHLIHSLSSVSNAVLLTRRDLSNALLGSQYLLSGEFPELVEGCKLKYDDGCVELIHPALPKNNLMADEVIGQLCEICDGRNVMPDVVRKFNCHLPYGERWSETKVRGLLDTLKNKGFISMQWV